MNSEEVLPASTSKPKEPDSPGNRVHVRGHLLSQLNKQHTGAKTDQESLDFLDQF